MMALAPGAVTLAATRRPATRSPERPSMAGVRPIYFRVRITTPPEVHLPSASASSEVSIASDQMLFQPLRCNWAEPSAIKCAGVRCSLGGARQTMLVLTPSIPPCFLIVILTRP